MREIKTKFKSCFENDTLEKEIVVFRTEDGKELGQVVLRQLKRGEVLELAEKSPEEYLLKCIESWTFKDKSDKLLEVNLDNIRLLTSTKKVGDAYSLGILDHLFQVAVEINIVSESAEKNSEKP
jgi:hypothetical protein